MRHDDHRHARLGQILHNVQHLADHFGVERGGRLVEEHHVRLHRKRAHYRNTLLLAAGELRGVRVGPVAKTDSLQKRVRLGFGLGLRHMLDQHGSHGHVAHYRLVREEVEMLEHHAHLPAVLVEVDFLALRVLLFRDVHALEHDAAARRLLKQVQRAQEGGFAGAGGADDDDDVALADIETHAVERLYLALVEMLFQVSNLYQNVVICLHGSSSFQNVRTAC